MYEKQGRGQRIKDNDLVSYNYLHGYCDTANKSNRRKVTWSVSFSIYFCDGTWFCTAWSKTQVAIVKVKGVSRRPCNDPRSDVKSKLALQLDDA